MPTYMLCMLSPGVELETVCLQALDLVRGHVGCDVDLTALEGGDAHRGFRHVAERQPSR